MKTINNTLGKIEYKPLDVKDAPLGLYAKSDLKTAIKADILEIVGIAEPCEPDCTPERHAYHEGQYQTILKIEAKLEEYFK